MTNKIMVCVLAVFFSLTAFAYAQQWPSAVSVVEMVRTELNLDQAQFDEVKIIIEENVAKRGEVAPQSTRGLSITQSRELDSEMYAKLNKILTEYQMKQWYKILASIDEKMDAAAATERQRDPLAK